MHGTAGRTYLFSDGFLDGLKSGLFKGIPNLIGSDLATLYLERGHLSKQGKSS